MNIALVKHDGTALNMPAKSIQGILPVEPTEDAADLNSVLFSGFRGGATFYLQDSANDVFEAIKAQSKEVEGWAQFAHIIEGQNIYLKTPLVEGYDEVKTADDMFYRVWVNNGTGLETMETCKHTPENLEALTAAIAAKGAA